MKRIRCNSKRLAPFLTIAPAPIGTVSTSHSLFVWLRRIGLNFIVFFLSFVVFCGCVSKNSRQGVENRWRSETAPVFKQGETTSHDVLAALGPPSQLINLGSQTVYYYLQEQKRTRSIILILYNQTREKISYDRAIFFFDQQGRLTDFAISDEKNPSP